MFFCGSGGVPEIKGNTIWSLNTPDAGELGFFATAKSFFVLWFQ
jgi:hypothetical protein